MRLSKQISALILSVFAGAALAFPLWLDFPGYRNNPHDPKSPLWRATNTPSPLPTRTFTISPSPTQSFTASPPYTATPTPTYTRTMTMTPTPTITPTFSITPYVYYDGDSVAMDNV